MTRSLRPLGIFLVCLLATPVMAQAGSDDATAPTGRLDGMRFAIALGPRGEAPDRRDALEFANGLFRSTECERICGYPPQPYFTRPTADGIGFIAELRSPDKNASLVVAR